jgi:uncharacterized protein (DUF427 family)
VSEEITSMFLSVARQPFDTTPVERLTTSANGVGRVEVLKRGDWYMRAIWNNAVLAESDNTVVVEGNHYFPPDSIRKEFLRASDTHTTCPWKGVASYYDVVVGGQVNRDAAWYYPDVKEAAAEIKGRVAFWKGVRVE